MSGFLAGCGQPSADDAPFAVTGSQLPNLDTAPDGSVVMSWVEPEGEGHRLRFARYRGGAWRESGTVARGERWFVNWADFPSVRVIDDDWWVAHWLVRGGWHPHAYDVLLSVSRDGGGSWSEPFPAHRDGTPTEHGFASIYPTAEGAGLVWLDGRETLSNTDGGQILGMTLRSATLSRGGDLRETLVDPLVCDCCHTDVAVSNGTPLLVYRDRSPGEVRDIRLARYEGGQWRVQPLVATDDWQVFGCPVNGPAIAASGDHVGVAWYTQGSGSPEVRFARSVDGGRSFPGVVAIDEDDPIGRVDVLMDEAGCALVSWIGRADGDQAALRYRYVDPTGQASDPGTIGAVSAARPSGFPRLARHGNAVLAAWTDVVGTDTRVRTREMPFACPGRG